MNEDVPDGRMVELYAEFRKRRKEVPWLQLAPYERIPLGVGILHWPYSEAANDRRHELANSINAFQRAIRSAQAWHDILRALPLHEQIEVLIEHVWDLAGICVDSPYLLKGRVIESVCALSSVAAASLSRPIGKPVKRHSIDEARRLASSWQAWPALESALDGISDATFKDATADLRNERHHGMPQSVEIGVRVRPVVKQSSGRNEISVAVLQPLKLEQVLPALVEQYRAVLVCFDEFSKLLTEQHETVRAHFEQRYAP